MILTTTVDQDNLMITMTIREYRSFWEHADFGLVLASASRLSLNTEVSMDS